MSIMNQQAHDAFTQIVKKFENDKKTASELMDNQRAMIAYARHVATDQDKNMRGFILFHGMGTGKTITSLRCAYEMLTNKRKKLFLIIPASLHHTPWVQSLTSSLAKHPNLPRSIPTKEIAQKLLDEQIFFIHHNANNISKRILAIGEELKSGNENIFNDSVVIIDEIHDFINTLVNTTYEHNAKLGLYKLLMSATNMKIISNTGTPFINTPFEMTFLINLHRGWEMFNTSDTSREAFNQTFFHNGKLVNAAMLHSGFYRIVSYFRANVQNMPTREYKDIQFLKYNSMQKLMNNYFTTEREQRDQAREEKMGSMITIHEWTERMKRAEALNAKGSLRTALNAGRIREEEMIGTEDYTQHDYLIGPRMISNFVLPPQYSKRFNPVIPHMISADKYPAWDMRQVIQTLVKEDPTFKTNVIKHLDQFSPKIARILQLVKGQPGPFMIYSNFKNYGIYPVAAILSILGYEEYTGLENPTTLTVKNRYIIYSGSVDSVLRSKLLAAYNHENHNGDKIRFILITNSGKQGISLEKTRKVFIMEPFWSNQLIEQVEARAIRINSHIGLPENERHVEIYKFIMIGPDSPELLLAQVALKKSINIYLVKRLMMRSAIDCHYHYKANFSDDPDTKCVPAVAIQPPKYGETVTYLANASIASIERVVVGDKIYLKRADMLYHDIPDVDPDDINHLLLKPYQVITQEKGSKNKAKHGDKTK